MLSNKVKLLLIAAIVSIAGSVSADEMMVYLGAEASILNKTNYNSGSTTDLNKFKTANSDTKLAIKKSKPGVNAFIGARFSEAFGAELGFGLIQKATGAGQPGQATNKITNFYVDVLAYMPVASKISLIGAAGIGALKSKASVVGATFQNLGALNRRKYSFRVGGGIQHDVTHNWGVRAMARYQKGNKAFLKSNVSLSLGVAYTF